MKRLHRPIELFLHPGEFHFAKQPVCISTLLGSCVAITLWHPEKLIGGMCHYMLPSNRTKKETEALDGKYAEDVMKMFMKEISVACTTPSEYHVKVFGGGHMFTNTGTSVSCFHDHRKCFEPLSCPNVACKNILAASRLLKKYGFKIKSSDLGGRGYRKVLFDVANGDVWLQRGSKL